MPVIAQAPSGFRLVVLVSAACSRSASRSSCSIDRQQIVRDGRRLRPLRVRVHREDVSRWRSARSSSASAQLERRGDQLEDELALPHPVHRHVDVVAAARRVQPAGDVVAARLRSSSRST